MRCPLEPRRPDVQRCMEESAVRRSSGTSWSPSKLCMVSFLPFSCSASMACWIVSGFRSCMRRAKEKVPGVLRAAWTLFVVSVTRQNECRRCSTCHEQRKRFTLAAS